MLKQKIFHNSKILAAVLTSLALVGVTTNYVRADSISDQINNLQAQNSQNQATVNNLSVQASSYEDAINKLDEQISTMQQQIVTNENKQADIQNQINQAQVELDHEKHVLGENIKAMYLEGNVSTLEILAASKNISDYVNKAEYRNSVQSKVKTALEKVDALKLELTSQKNAIDSLLAQQQSVRSQLATSQSQQSQLLAYTEGQKAAYSQQIQANNSKIAALMAQQVRANNTASVAGYYFLRFPGTVISHDPSVNDYPYAYAGFGMSTAPGCVDNDGPDQWGYCTRQCVSYVAWAVARSGRNAPMYYGNAKDWVNHAYNDGVPVYTSDPQPGDVAISTAGTWGHAMYVEAVSGNKILVSEYNNFLTGQYYTEWRTFQ